MQVSHHPAAERKKRRDHIYLFLLLLSFSILFCAFIPGWIVSNNPTTELPFSLHSFKEADYTLDQDFPVIPAIGFGIIRDILRDQHVNEAEIEQRLGTLSALLLTPVPLSTGMITTPFTPPVVTSPAVPTLIRTEAPLPTPFRATPLPIILPTRLPTEKPYQPSPAIEIQNQIKFFVDNDSSTSVTLNDQVQYQFLVRNTGDTYLQNIQVMDQSFGSPVSCPFTTLADGAEMICTADTIHIISLPESNAGGVTLLAAASGKFNRLSYSASSTIHTPISQNPSLQLKKSLAAYDDNDKSNSVSDEDDLWYRFDITNTGNVTLTEPAVVDQSFDLPVICPRAALDPGETITCTASLKHTLSAVESSASQVINTATASAQFNTLIFTVDDTLTLAVHPKFLPNPVISVIKTLASYDDNDLSNSITLNDGLWYHFLIKNEGNVVLTSITVEEDLPALPVTCPATALAPGEKMLCTADNPLLISASDVSARQVTNTVRVTGYYFEFSNEDEDTLITEVVNPALGSVSGQVREDLDGDGDLLDEDPGIAGVTVFLTDSTDKYTYATTTTDAGGYFTFRFLTAGQYAVHEIDLPGYTSTADSVGPNNNRMLITIVAGQNITQLKFLDKKN